MHGYFLFFPPDLYATFEVSHIVERKNKSKKGDQEIILHRTLPQGKNFPNFFLENSGKVETF